MPNNLTNTFLANPNSNTLIAEFPAGTHTDVDGINSLPAGFLFNTENRIQESGVSREFDLLASGFRILASVLHGLLPVFVRVFNMAVILSILTGYVNKNISHKGHRAW